MSDLKYRLAALRKRIGDDGRDFPETEKVLQAHWEYDEQDRKEAVELSHQFLARRLDFLKNPPKKKASPKKKPLQNKK